MQIRDAGELTLEPSETLVNTKTSTRFTSGVSSMRTTCVGELNCFLYDSKLNNQLFFENNPMSQLSAF